MDATLTPDLIDVIRTAARALTGYRRRAFQAEMAERYCGGKPRQAEAVFGWGRAAVATGLGERRTGIRCLDNVTARGRHRTEDDHPDLVARTRAVVEPQTQADPTFQSPLGYTRVTAAAVRRHLTGTGGGSGTPVPAERALPDILNRLGYRLRRVRKTAPRKIPAADAIFAHLQVTHTAAAGNPETLRISVDTQAKVKIGPFSRGGRARGGGAVRAADHECTRWPSWPRPASWRWPAANSRWCSAHPGTRATSWPMRWTCGGPTAGPPTPTSVGR
jgi:hypothetical protein